MKKTKKELIEIIDSRSSANPEEKERIYKKFFENWQEEHEYIYNKFGIDFDMKILDIGCGRGYNLIHFNEDSLGIEANKELADFAKSLGLNVISINAEDDLKTIDKKFDLIWCTDFLVHMVSPYKFLHDCRSLLLDGGKLLIQIPLMSLFNMHRSNCHFYAFNKKSLLYVMEMAGFEVIKTSGFIRKKSKLFNFIFEPMLQIWGGNIWVLARKKEKTPIDPERVYLPKWFQSL